MRVYCWRRLGKTLGFGSPCRGPSLGPRGAGWGIGALHGVTRGVPQGWELLGFGAVPRGSKEGWGQCQG